MISLHSDQVGMDQQALITKTKAAPVALLFDVPPAEKQHFARLPDSCRKEVAVLLKAAWFISQNANSEAAIRSQAARLGLNPSTLRQKYYRFLREKDWTVFVNKAKAGPEWWNSRDQVGLPGAFISFWKTLCERDQRTLKGAHRELLQIWRTGVDSLGERYNAIPGYDIWPEADVYTGIPKGWSYENLDRHASDSFELQAARKGRTAASDHRRKVFTTRADLAVGQFILFDDQEYDLKVNFLGEAQRKAMRPLGLNALDLFSGCCFAWGVKPTLIGEDGAKKKLKERDMLWFVVHVLTAFGYRTDERGTHFVVEHGTAAISKDFEARIIEVTGGKVSIDRSGIGGKASLPALFDGPKKGNPRFKAPLESFFNVVRTHMAMLPGQTGLDRDNCPADLHGRDQYNYRMLKAAELLGPEVAQKLKLPFLSWPEFVHAAARIYQAINSRTDHDLQGWAEAGHIMNEWRLAPEFPWTSMDSFLALPPMQQAALDPILKSDPRLTRSRRMSPQEAWNLGATGLQKVSNSLLPHLLGINFAHNKTVRGGYITIEDQEISQDPIRFPAYPFKDGESFQCFLNPFNPTVLVLADKDLRFVGELFMQELPSRADADAVVRQIARSRQEEAARLEPMNLRHVDRARRKAEMHKHNADLIDPPRGKVQRMSSKDMDSLSAPAGVAPSESFEDLEAIYPTSEEPRDHRPHFKNTIPPGTESGGITLNEMSDL